MYSIKIGKKYSDISTLKNKKKVKNCGLYILHSILKIEKI